MTIFPPLAAWHKLKASALGIFNLNDGQWGRPDKTASDKPDGAKPSGEATSADKPAGQDTEAKPESSTPEANKDQAANAAKPQLRGIQCGASGGSGGGSNGGPPDLDELWREFSKRINQLFGNKGANGSKRDGGAAWGGQSTGAARVQAGCSPQA